MKSKLNLWLACSFICAALLTAWVYVKLTHQVGDITFERNHDSNEFKLCNEETIFQYYSIDTDYESGKRAIKQKLQKQFSNTYLAETGLLTIRFILNCEGLTGRFRAKMIDSSLKDIDISKYNLSPLFLAISELKDWNVGTIRNEPQNSYYQISFKLNEGQLIDVF